MLAGVWMGSAHCLLVVEHDTGESGSLFHGLLSSTCCLRGDSQVEVWEGKLMAGRALCRGMVSAEWATGIVSHRGWSLLSAQSLLISSLLRAGDARDIAYSCNSRCGW